MSHEHRGSSVATYTLIALILGVITYLEFSVVEHDIPWLSNGETIAALIIMSLIKFALVVAFFMHLKDDERTYTGFFSTGMIFALATFIALGLLFTFRGVSSAWARAYSGTGVVAASEGAPGEEHEASGIPEEVKALITSDGYSRQLSEVLDTPRPKNQSLTSPPPAAELASGFTLKPAPPLFTSATPASTTPTPSEPASGATQTPEPSTTETPAVPAAVEWDQALGEQTFANCVGCHQATGKGIPGAFPPLAEHLPKLYNADGGRSYLIKVLLYGLQGKITVSGQDFNGAMPSWQNLGDEQIAAVMNHELTSWGNDGLVDSFTPYQAEEVSAQRDQGLTPAQVLELRGSLELP